MKRIAIFLLAIFLISCSPAVKETQLANPASVHCNEQNGTLDIRNTEAGQVGYCLKNDKECEEWAYFRGECKLEKEAVVQNVAETSQPKTEESKFLVHYPWTKGESWTLTTDFHDQNCLDFVNFDDDNAEVVAAADGQVLLSKFSFPNNFYIYGEKDDTNPANMGNFVILQHNLDTYTIYMHLQYEDTPPVSMGDTIKAGTRIGYVGSTGFNYHPPKENHLHFCVVDVSIFPVQSFITKPLDSWGFIENDGSNILELDEDYVSENN